MNLRFVNWYTQALGATLGIIACIYAYLNGFMFVYGNIEAYFDFLGFTGVVSSYTLLPLCILTLMFAISKPYIEGKTFCKFSLDNINLTLIVTTIIIGFMGAKIYFTIPALFIVFNLYSDKLFNKEHKIQQSLNIIQEDNQIKAEYSDIHNIINANEIFEDEKTINLSNNLALNLENGAECVLFTNKNKVDLIKREMALELLQKNSDVQFIKELTGLSDSDIEFIKLEIKR